jgi:tRNA threonylcarbamoyladenosine modification (KEOPS) complex  Pcc1 subunit
VHALRISLPNQDASDLAHLRRALPSWLRRLRLSAIFAGQA